MSKKDDEPIHTVTLNIHPDLMKRLAHVRIKPGPDWKLKKIVIQETKR